MICFGVARMTMLDVVLSATARSYGGDSGHGLRNEQVTFLPRSPLSIGP
jgi:hypothetical protein